MRPFGYFLKYENLMERRLREIGLTNSEIHKVISSLPPEKIPLFIEKWVQEKNIKSSYKNNLNEQYDSRAFDSAPVNKQIPYLPRMVPNLTSRISSKEMNEKYQQTTQKRTNPQANLDIHAMQLFGNIDDDMTLDYLNKTYRKLALQFHPDKQNGDSTKFNILNTAYNHLKSKISDRINQEQLLQKKQSTNRQPTQTFEPKPPPDELFENKFDPNKFNEYYSKNSFKTKDHGYGDWLKEKPSVQLPNKPSDSNFNEVYEKHKMNVAKSQNLSQKNSQLTQYKPPDDLLQNTNFVTLGNDNNEIKDYSGYTSQNGIQFTDLRKAHENNHLAYENNTHVSNNENIENAFKNAKQNLQSKPEKLTQFELDAIHQRQQEIKEEEDDRRYRSQQYDEDISEYFKKINHKQLTM